MKHRHSPLKRRGEAKWCAERQVSTYLLAIWVGGGMGSGMGLHQGCDCRTAGRSGKPAILRLHMLGLGSYNY